MNGEMTMSTFLESMQVLLADGCMGDGNDGSLNPFTELLQLFILADPTTKMLGYLCSNGVDPSLLQNFSPQTHDYADQSESVAPNKKKRVRKHTSKGIRRPPNKWTKEESERLIGLVERMGDKKWKKIAQSFGAGKTGAQCAQHWKRVLCPVIRKGAWNVDEEEQLFILVEKHGQAWKKIASELVNRTDIQCRYQYLKAMESVNIPWSAEEEALLLQKVYESGTAAAGGEIPWIEVSRHVAKGKHTKLPRTALECKSKYHNLVSSLAQPPNPPPLHFHPEYIPTQPFVQLNALPPLPFSASDLQYNFHPFQSSSAVNGPSLAEIKGVTF
eukprot:TRINITY_DN2613_c0_g1_i11.p1 TRINITY_DN2613_c0_g1~~TRINITY_DN2613_c0_g1_i11.p1  ORF type:complete len:329 (+),score=56.74 TRINITY_DN2613_c0_g1_i11:126-1112(+)